MSSGFYEDFQDWTFVTTENKGILMLLTNTGKHNELKYMPVAIARVKETITCVEYDALCNQYIVGYTTGAIEVYQLITSDGKEEFKIVIK